MEIQTEECSISTPMGHQLTVIKFVPQQTLSHVVVITSATGVLQKYYAKFAEFLAAKGVLVYTFDYYGIGKSNGSSKELKKNKVDVISWGQNDQAAVIAHAKKENPSLKLALIGHSIGGQLLGFNPNYHMLNKVILVASQTGYWKYFNGLHGIKMLLFWYVIVPLFTPIFGYFPAKKLGLFENLPKSVVYEWASWGRQPNYLMASYNEQSHLFDKIDIPILALSFSKDTFAPRGAVDWLMKQYKNAKVQRVHHEPKTGGRHVKHFGFFKAWAEDPFWEQCYHYILNESYEV